MIPSLFENVNWAGYTEAFINTITLVSAAIVLSSLLGALMGLSLYYLPLRAHLIFRVYIDIVRGLPALVIIFISYYLLGYVVEQFGFQLTTYGSALIALVVAGTADMAEITRGALGTVSSGQLDAGKASGLRFRQIFFGIITRQALVQATPPWTNSATELVKNSTLLSLVGLNELVRQTATTVTTEGNALMFYIAVALVFILINLAVQASASIVERSIDYPRR